MTLAFRRTAFGLVLLLAAALGAGAPPARAAFVPSADELYMRARDRQQHWRVSLFVRYQVDQRKTITPHASSGGSSRTDVRHLDMVVRSTDQWALIIDPNGRDRATEPAITPMTYLNPSAPSIGASPFAGFSIATEPGDPGATDWRDYQPMARRSAHYFVRNAGVETVDGHSAYHLVLTPRLRPRSFVTRELWIDTRTYDTYKAVVLTQPAYGVDAVPIFALLHFTFFDGAWLVRSIDANWNTPSAFVTVRYRFRDMKLIDHWDDFDDYPPIS